MFFAINAHSSIFSKRVDEVGYDRKGRYYYVLDDNRLYRRTNPPLPPPKPVKPKKSKSARAMRASKRRKLSGYAIFDSEEENETNGDDDVAEEYTGEYEWECIAVTLADYRQFIGSLQKTKDPDEKELRDTLVENVIPFMEKIEEEQQRKILKREKELFNLQLLASAKRSSRLAHKAEKERQEREAIEAARKHEMEEATARKEQEKQKKMEEERRSRIISREQRMKDREQKRLLHEAELERIAEEQKKLERGESRISERHLQAELEKRKRSLEELNNEENWFFDCSGCGVHGENLDDGTHSVACEKCNVWQHSRCLGIAQDEAEREDFHFVCNECKRREEEARLPKLPPLKFRIGTSSASQPFNTIPINGKGESAGESKPPTSPMKKEKNGISLHPTSLQPGSPQLSPERRPLTATQNHSIPYQAPQSPSKNVNGFGASIKQHEKQLPGQFTFPPGQHVFPLSNSPFASQRPSSSHSSRSPTLPSPIQNRPSMSPTQGNRDVGPLAGFPPTAPSNESAPWTSFGPQQASHADVAIRPSSSPIQNGYPSFSAVTPGSASFIHSPLPPQSSPGVPSSGLSPTKQQSPRPMSAGGLVGPPVMPPVQRLEPSPKLMGRSSPDAPIPPPVKTMPPEQEERRQRQLGLFPSRTESRLSNNQPVVLNGSPSFDIPPLGPSVVSQQQFLPMSSPTRGDCNMNGQ